MARGWESKSVEEQMSLGAHPNAPEPAADPARKAAQELLSQRQSLELSRERIVREWNETSHPRRRAQLAEALAYLEQQLQMLEPR